MAGIQNITGGNLIMILHTGERKTLVYNKFVSNPDDENELTIEVPFYALGDEALKNFSDYTLEDCKGQKFLSVSSISTNEAGYEVTADGGRRYKLRNYQ